LGHYWTGREYIQVQTNERKLLMVPTIFAEQALLPHGWARNVAIEVDADGTIAAVRPGANG
jgi:hypothetical protein